MAKGFSGYFGLLTPWPGWLSSSLLVFVLVGVAAWGVKQSVALAILTTLLELGGLLLAMAVSGDELLHEGIRWEHLLPPMTTTAFAGVINGGFLAFFCLYRL